MGLIALKKNGVSTLQNGTVVDPAFTCNLSTVNGTAFITNPKFDLTGFVNSKFTLTAGGKTLAGWGKAAGTGETYLDIIGGTNPALRNGNFSLGDDGTWTKETGWNIAGGTGNRTVNVGGQYLYQSNVLPVTPDGQLIKNVFTITDYTAGGIRISLGGIITGTTRNSVDTFTEYKTLASGSNRNLGFEAITASTAILKIGSTTFQQVLTPSLTAAKAGITIVSAQGGSTFNWASDDGIVPNSATFTLTITPS